MNKNIEEYKTDVPVANSIGIRNCAGASRAAAFEKRP